MGALTTIAVLAGTYLLVALGVVVVYKSSRVLNFAGGEMALLSGYVALSLLDITGISWLAIVGTLGISTVVGFAIYWLVMRPLTGQPHHIAILATVALSIILRAVIIIGWRAETTALYIGTRTLLTLSTGQVRVSDAAAVVVGALVFFALLAFYRWTRYGIRMRSVADNPLLGAQRGVNLHLTLALAWALAGLGGGIAGILYGSRALLSLQSVHIGLQGLTAALVGGLDSVPGAALGALIIAAAEYFTIGYLDPSLSDVLPFGVLLVILILRPWGLFGTKEELERV